MAGTIKNAATLVVASRPYIMEYYTNLGKSSTMMAIQVKKLVFMKVALAFGIAFARRKLYVAMFRMCTMVTPTGDKDAMQPFDSKIR